MTSPGKGRKGHGRHHGPECADGSRCVEVPVGREDEVSFLVLVLCGAAIFGGAVARFAALAFDAVCGLSVVTAYFTA